MLSRLHIHDVGAGGVSVEKPAATNRFVTNLSLLDSEIYDGGASQITPARPNAQHLWCSCQNTTSHRHPRLRAHTREAATQLPGARASPACSTVLPTARIAFSCFVVWKCILVPTYAGHVSILLVTILNTLFTGTSTVPVKSRKITFVLNHGSNPESSVVDSRTQVSSIFVGVRTTMQCDHTTSPTGGIPSLRVSTV